MGKKQLQGVVVNVSADSKTVVVDVSRMFEHPRYKKRLRVNKRYMAHSRESVSRAGDTVAIEESRPLSKRKRWEVVSVIRRASVATQTDEARKDSEAKS